jgi:hypothetical protein
MHRVQGHCHGEESTCQVKVLVFSSEQIPVTLSELPNNTVDSPFVPTLYTFAYVLCVFAVPFLGQVGTCPSVIGYMSLPDSTPQRHAAAIPEIKLLDLV